MEILVNPVSTTAWCGVERRTLAIVGSHPKGRDGIPWDDPEVEVMLFNEAPMRVEKYPRWDLALQIHGEEVYSSPDNWVNKDHWAWLQQSHGRPIYMQAVDPRVPDSVRYPLEEILSMTPYRYLRSSPAMGLALGIYLGYDTIMLFGSELTSNTEYFYQATNYAFWIGYAHGRGVDLQLRCWQDEFHQRIYGYEGELQIDREYFRTRAAAHMKAWKINEKALDRAQERMSQAMLENDYDQVGKLALMVEDLAAITGEAYGMMKEAERYAGREDMISRQEFERQVAKTQQDGDKLRSQKDHAGGKLEYVWNSWRQTGLHQALAQVRAFVKEERDLAFQAGVQSGMMRENQLYMAEYDTRLGAAGGVRALGKKEAEMEK